MKEIILIIHKTLNYQMSDNSLIYFLCRWLMSTGQGERTVKIMKKIARMNGKSVNKVIYLLISVPKANYSHPGA